MRSLPAGQAHGVPCCPAQRVQHSLIVALRAGLCFSVRPGVKIPPSLRNIYKEIKEEYPEFDVPKHGCVASIHAAMPAPVPLFHRTARNELDINTRRGITPV